MAWTYTQSFEGLNTTYLDGQDSWVNSSGGRYSVTTAKSYLGTKSIVGVNINGNTYRNITSVSDGTFYVAILRTDTTGDANFDLVKAGTGTRIRLSFQAGKIYITNNTGTVNLLNPFIVDTWYVFEITFNSSNEHYVRYSTAGIWSSQVGPYTGAVSGNIDRININSGAANTVYIDEISVIDPTSTSFVPVASSFL